MSPLTKAKNGFDSTPVAYPGRELRPIGTSLQCQVKKHIRRWYESFS